MSETEPHWASSALLTIDTQVDFVVGPHAVHGTAAVVPNLRILVDAFRRAGRPVVHVVRIYLPDGSNADLSRRGILAGGAVVVRPGTPGVELAAGLSPDPAPLDTTRLLRGELQSFSPTEFAMYKPRWNAFFGTVLDDWLRARSVDTVVIAGCNFPNCPRATLFGASERDYSAVAVTDAMSGWAANSCAELAGIGVHSAATVDVRDALASLPPDRTGPG